MCVKEEQPLKSSPKLMRIYELNPLLHSNSSSTNNSLDEPPLLLTLLLTLLLLLLITGIDDAGSYYTLITF